MFIPFAASSLARANPIPSLPPVTTAHVPALAYLFLISMAEKLVKLRSAKEARDDTIWRIQAAPSTFRPSDIMLES